MVSNIFTGSGTGAASVVDADGGMSGLISGPDIYPESSECAVPMQKVQQLEQIGQCP